MGGVDARAAVVFSAATQAIGIGVFTPLNWLVKNPAVFRPAVLARCLLPGVVGLVLALVLLPIRKAEAVLLVFSGFCAFLFCYVAYGLVKGHLSGSGKLDASPDGFRFTPKTAAIYVPLCLLGGALTGYIGIGIEKVVFCLLTWHLGMDVRQACLTSITLVGWISAVSLVFHLLCSAPHVAPHSALAASARMDEALPHLHCAPRTSLNTGEHYDPYVPGYVPFEYWLMGLPGVLFGSFVGPMINSKIGSRNVMKVFCVFLLADVVYNLVEIFGHK